MRLLQFNYEELAIEKKEIDYKILEKLEE